MRPPNKSAAGAFTTTATIDTITTLADQVLHCHLTLHSPLPYQPGQYCMVAIDDTARAFSFSTPDNSSSIEFLISVAPGGIASRYWRNAKPGHIVSFTGPYGDFIIRDGDPRPLLFIAGGVGLAPIRAHLFSLLRQPNTRPLTLIVSHRSIARMFWHTELSNLAQRHDFTYHGVVGRPLTKINSVPRLTEHTIYICGSAAMCTATAATLYQRGVHPRYVHYELFT